MCTVTVTYWIVWIHANIVCSGLRRDLYVVKVASSIIYDVTFTLGNFYLLQTQNGYMITNMVTVTNLNYKQISDVCSQWVAFFDPLLHRFCPCGKFFTDSRANFIVTTVTLLVTGCIQKPINALVYVYVVGFVFNHAWEHRFIWTHIAHTWAQTHLGTNKLANYRSPHEIRNENSLTFRRCQSLPHPHL